MAELITLPTFSDNRGKLSVIEKIIPFEIKRVFFIYEVDSSVRGKHRHKKTRQAAVCISGRCTIYSFNGIREDEFVLDSPSKCLILEPEDWHKMYDFAKGTILLVVASEFFNESDYIFEPYK